MSLKAKLQLWNAALEAYDAGEYAKSLEVFSTMDPTSKILTDMGLILATIGEHEKAVEYFIQAIHLDSYLAVAYFQCGVSNFLLGRYDFALKDFEDAWSHLRGNHEIRYEQLGLKFVLYSAEVLFNKGLTLIYSGYRDEGVLYLKRAKASKVTEEHDVIDEAIRFQGEQYTVFSIPVGIIYRPSPNKLKSARTKDFMGQAKLVAAAESNDNHTEFTGVARMRKGISPNGLLRTDSDPNLPSKTPDAEINPYRASIRHLTQLARSVPDEARKNRASKARFESSDRPSLKSATRASSKEWTKQVSPPSPPQGRPANQEPRKRLTMSDEDRTETPLLECYCEYHDACSADIPPSSLNSRKASPDGQGPNMLVRQISRTSRKANSLNDSPKSSLRYQPASYINRGPNIKRRRKNHGALAIAYGMAREEEEGYASWDGSDESERRKIRIRIHYRNDVRGMAMWPETPFDDFMQMVTKKFGNTNGLGLKFKDDDGEVISLKDESDYELAIEIASAIGESPTRTTEGKLEIWCVDL